VLIVFRCSTARPVPKPQGEPQLYLEIRLDDGRVRSPPPAPHVRIGGKGLTSWCAVQVGQIGVREGDNAFHLAEVFARAFKLDRSHIKKLALLIQQQVREYNKTHQVRAPSVRPCSGVTVPTWS
jgi:hypothetical protein